MQKLQCTIVNFFNSEEATNRQVKTNFQPNAHLLGSPDLAVWGVTDALTIARLGFANTRHDSLRFSAFTSSVMSSGARKLQVSVDISARNVTGIVSAGGEELYYRVTISWVPDPELPLPDWMETLQLIRLGLSEPHGQEGGMHTIGHEKLGRIKVIQKKGRKS